MKKTILMIILLSLFLTGCAKVSETQTPVKENVKEVIAGPAVEEPEKETSQAVTVAGGEQEPEASSEATMPAVAQMLILIGETKTLKVGDKNYEVKLLSVSNRAQFDVNGEITKDLILNGVHTLRDQSELKVINIGYNSATIQIRLKEQAVPSSDVAGPSATGPLVLRKGIFTSAAKTTTGSLDITKSGEGKIILTFTSFRTEPGPGLYVYLVNQAVSDGYEVAKLISREGGQKYDLPRDIDLNKYKKVLIYSKSEGKTYGQAVLT
ncbi:MAG: DM13 domain-containing protein [Candidatus Woesearchaeota archaeon]